MENMRFSGVKVHVVGHKLPFFKHDVQQQVFRSASLVRRQHMPIPGYLLHSPLEVKIVLAAGISLVAEHHARPLVVAHG